MNRNWTTHEIKIVRAMVIDGETAASIAKAIGRTRNAVIGQVHRMQARGESIKLARKPFAAVPAEAQRSKKAAKVALPNVAPPAVAAPAIQVALEAVPEPHVIPAPEPAPITCKPVSLMDLQQCHCRWPLFSNARKQPVAKLLFCGAEATKGPYCAEHSAKAIDRSATVEVNRRAFVRRSAAA